MNERRFTMKLYLCAIKRITVDRHNIVETVLNAYRADLELEHHELFVTLKDESAQDVSGVTKEMYQLFFQKFSEKHLVGNLQKVPDNDHR